MRRFAASVTLLTAAVALLAAPPAGVNATRAAPPVLFVFAHPDDETLAAAVSIAEHVAAGNAVHVLWLSRGEASGARQLLAGTGTSIWWGVPHQPADEGYTAPDAAEFGAARIREATAAVRLLASGYPGTLSVHEAGLPDGGITQASAEQAIAELADQVAPGAAVRVKTHSHLVDNNPDHLAAGRAARALKAAEPTRYPDVRHYVLPRYWSDPRLAQVAEFWDTPSDPGVAARARNACRAFAAWSPPATFAIGYHSVAAMFAAIEDTPRSLVHP